MPSRVLKYLLSAAAFALIFAAVMQLLFAVNHVPSRSGDLPLYIVGGFFGKLAYDAILKAVRKGRR